MASIIDMSPDSFTAKLHCLVSLARSQPNRGNLQSSLKTLFQFGWQRALVLLFESLWSSSIDMLLLGLFYRHSCHATEGDDQSTINFFFFIISVAVLWARWYFTSSCVRRFVSAVSRLVLRVRSSTPHTQITTILRLDSSDFLLRYSFQHTQHTAVRLRSEWVRARTFTSRVAFSELRDVRFSRNLFISQLPSSHIILISAPQMKFIRASSRRRMRCLFRRTQHCNTTIHDSSYRENNHQS